MPTALVAILFTLLSLFNWLGSFIAIFPLLGMATNANGFLSSDGDLARLIFLASLPVCAILSGVLDRFFGRREMALMIAAVPAAIGVLIFT